MVPAGAIAGKSVPQLLGALVVQVRCGPPRPEGRIAGARLYRDVPPLSTKLKVEGVWNVEFHRELDMTDDAWRFRRRRWLLERGCRPENSGFVAQTADWYKSRSDEFVPGARYIVPEGTEVPRHLCETPR
jgi:hypothetical protein